MRRSTREVMPGFGLTLGVTIFCLSAIVVAPAAALAGKAMAMPWGRFAEAVLDPRTLAAFRLTVLASLAAATVNMAFGFVVAWTFTRYSFPGKRIWDAMVDLPFALPTAVSGISLATVYSKTGWIGRWLDQVGVSAAYTPLGVVIALVFVGLPFVVRTLQPAIEDLDPASEEAAETLGAGRRQTFLRVLLPTLAPPWLVGFSLAFARALGEYGSVIFIAGNMPMRTEIAALVVAVKLEEFDYEGATAVGAAMLAVSLALMLLIHLLERWARHRLEGA